MLLSTSCQSHRVEAQSDKHSEKHNKENIKNNTKDSGNDISKAICKKPVTYSDLTNKYKFLNDKTDKYCKINDIEIPDGYKQIKLNNEYQKWVTEVPLYSNQTKVFNYKGETIRAPANVKAVVAIDILGSACQCADMAMLLWSHYNLYKGNYGEIAFTSVSGQTMKYKNWINGSRYKLSKDGQKLVEVKSEKYKVAPSRSSLENYLKFAFLYANSFSMHKETKGIKATDVMPGDLWIQPPKQADGSLGHVSIVFNVVVNEKGEKLYLMGYGFTPAMSLFIAKPELNLIQGKSDWFTEKGFKMHTIMFGSGTWRRFY